MGIKLPHGPVLPGQAITGEVGVNTGRPVRSIRVELVEVTTSCRGPVAREAVETITLSGEVSQAHTTLAFSLPSRAIGPDVETPRGRRQWEVRAVADM